MAGPQSELASSNVRTVVPIRTIPPDVALFRKESNGVRMRPNRCSSGYAVWGLSLGVLAIETIRNRQRSDADSNEWRFVWVYLSIQLHVFFQRLFAVGFRFVLQPLKVEHVLTGKPLDAAESLILQVMPQFMRPPARLGACVEAGFATENNQIVDGYRIVFIAVGAVSLIEQPRQRAGVIADGEARAFDELIRNNPL